MHDFSIILPPPSDQELRVPYELKCYESYLMSHILWVILTVYESFIFELSVDFQ